MKLFIYTNNIKIFIIKNNIWRKIDLNYHICNANTTDYQLSDFPLVLISF